MSLLISGALMLGFGHACSKYTADGSGTLALSNEDGDRIVLNEKTVSTVYSKQVLDNMVSCLGIGQASNSAKEIFENMKQSVSERGKAKELTPPMLMGITSLAGEVCQQLVDQEKALSEKRIFSGFDFNSGSVGDSDVSAAVTRLARSCWLRNETNSENNAILDSVYDSFGSNLDPEDVAVYTCTAVLASFDSIQM